MQIKIGDKFIVPDAVPEPSVCRVLDVGNNYVSITWIVGRGSEGKWELPLIIDRILDGYWFLSSPVMDELWND